jgi:hypothetical protein
VFAKRGALVGAGRRNVRSASGKEKRTMKGRKMRRMWIFLCLLGLAAVFASSAGAVQPERFPEKGHVGDVYDFPAGSVCSFHVSVEFFRREGSFFTFSNGVQKFAYTFWINFTNVDTGQTRVLHEAGSVIFTNLGDDLLETITDGRELSVFFPGDRGPGSPGEFVFIVGRSREVDEVPGPNPNPFGLTTLSFQVLSGSAENLCETMA